MKRQIPFFMVITLVVAGQTTIHAEQVAFQLEDRPLVQLVEAKLIQTKRNLDWSFPMSIRYLGYSSNEKYDFSRASEGEWYQIQPQQRGSSWNGFCIASNAK
ncbi:MAG: hypothetical protein ABGX16_04945 [Pirellulales bacterium]